MNLFDESSERFRLEPRRRLFRQQQAAGELDRTVEIMEPPQIIGPYAVPGDPSVHRYEIAARLALPSADTEVSPMIDFSDEQPRGSVDIRWIMQEHRAPRGVWERKAVITIPRQYTIKSFVVTPAPLLREQEAAA